MRRKPRPSGQPIIVRPMMIRLALAGLFMAIAALVLVEIGKTTFGSLQEGQTMGLVGLSLMNIFLTLNLRFPEDSAFGEATLSNSRLLIAFLWVVVGTMLITGLPLLREVFQMTDLDINQWGMCLIPGIILLVLGEIYKFVLRALRPKTA
jgi:P-type Ca2+ transporter type 2C